MPRITLGSALTKIIGKSLGGKSLGSKALGGKSLGIGVTGLAAVTAGAIVVVTSSVGGASPRAGARASTALSRTPTASKTLPDAASGRSAMPPDSRSLTGRKAPDASPSSPTPGSTASRGGGSPSASASTREAPAVAARGAIGRPIPTTAAPKPAAPKPAPTTAQPAPTTAPAAAPAPAPVVASRPGGRPGPTNTGVPGGTELSVVNGSVTVTKDGTVIDAKDIKGALIIEASHVTVTRSLIEGSASSDSVVVKSGSDILLQDDEVAVAHPSVSHDAMSVRNATLNRLNIHGGVDGMKLSSDSTVEHSWIHSLNYFSSDPAQGGGPTHNDAIQIMSGSGIHITGNYLQVTSSNNSAIQVTQDAGTTTGLVVSGNWADGGGCTYNFSGHGPGGKLLPMSGITVTDNRFGHDMRFAGCAILTDLQTTISQSGNVYDDTGAPIKLQRHN